MKVIPAIDLIDGSCVRLYQGDYNNQKTYDIDPTSLALTYQRKGAERLHLVDLAGAKEKQLVQYPLVSKIVKAVDIPVQFGGGIRSENDIEQCLQTGINKVVIGSLAVTDPIRCKSLITQFQPSSFVLALDVSFIDNQPMVLSHAWTNNSGVALWDLVKQYEQVGVNTILCTDIACDGTLQGPNIPLYEQAVNRFPNIDWQASGGIRGHEDLTALKRCGINSAIIGKALYEQGDIASLFLEASC